MDTLAPISSLSPFAATVMLAVILALILIPYLFFRLHDATLSAPWRMEDREARRRFGGPSGTPFLTLGATVLRLPGPASSLLVLGDRREADALLLGIIGDGHTGAIGRTAPMLLIDPDGRLAPAVKARREAAGRNVRVWTLPEPSARAEGPAVGYAASPTHRWNPLSDLALIADFVRRSEATLRLAEAIVRLGRIERLSEDPLPAQILAGLLQAEISGTTGPDAAAPHLARVREFLFQDEADFERSLLALRDSPLGALVQEAGRRAEARLVSGAKATLAEVRACLLRHLAFLDDGHLAPPPAPVAVERRKDAAPYAGPERRKPPYSLLAVARGEEDLIVSEPAGIEVERPQIVRMAISLLCSLSADLAAKDCGAAQGEHAAQDTPAAHAASVLARHPSPLIVLPELGRVGFLREFVHHPGQDLGRALFVSWISERAGARALMGLRGWEAVEHSTDVRITLAGTKDEDAVWEEGMIEYALDPREIARVHRGHAVALSHRHPPICGDAFRG